MLRDSRLVLVMAVAVGLWVPLAWMQWFNCDEHSSYVWRTIEFARELRAGELYPRWCPDFYGGYGSPLFVFYGPVIYGVAGLLTATFFNPFWSLKLVVLGASLLAGVGTYRLILGETRQRDAALLGAVAYLAAPYRIGDVYNRGDLGEFSALAVLPVVIALYRAAAREARPSRARWLMAAAALSVAVLIMTHPVLGLWGTVVVGLVVAASAVELAYIGAWRRAVLLLATLLCAPGLAGIYIVPAMAYKGLTHTAGMVVGFYAPQNQWIHFATLFKANIQIFGRNFMQIGQILVVATVVSVLGLLLDFKRARPVLGWLALTSVLVGLCLPIGYGFWTPGRVPLSQFIQFPWRLLGPAALTACVALGIGAAAVGDRLAEQTRAALAIAGATAFLCVIAWPYVSALEVPTADIPADADALRNGIYSATDADEYLPLAVSAPPKAPAKKLVAEERHATVASTSSDGSHHTLSIAAAKPDASIDLALYHFPGWRVKTVSGPAKASLDADPNGLIRLHLPASGEYQLKVFYGTSPAAWVGIGVSALSLLILLSLLLRGSRFWPSPVPVSHRLGGAT